MAAWGRRVTFPATCNLAPGLVVLMPTLPLLFKTTNTVSDTTNESENLAPPATSNLAPGDALPMPTLLLN